MSSRPYKGFFIAVEVVPRSLGSLFLSPVVKVSAEGEGAAIATIFDTAYFRLNKDAEAYGFKLGEKWIDTRLDPSKS